MWTAGDFGQSLVLLSLVFLGAALIRSRWTSLRALFIPTAVIGGFLALALGPEGVGRVTDSNGVFPDQTFAVWTALPGLLINVMCASLLLGERLPSLKSIWNISGDHGSRPASCLPANTRSAAYLYFSCSSRSSTRTARQER